MDSYEAVRAVFTRIQSIDPDNAHKIIGYILLKDQAEKEMIRLAFAPENLIHSIISIAKAELGLSSNTSSATNTSSSSSPFTPTCNPISISRPNPQPLSLPSPRLAHNGFNSSSPSSPSVWSVSGSGNHLPLSPDANNSLSYAAVVNGTATANGSLSSLLSSSQVALNPDLQEQKLPFSNDPLELPSKNVDFLDQPLEMAMSPGGRSDSLLYPCWENASGFENNGHLHRRSSSVNDICLGTDDSTSGFGYKPCLYFSRGFCKNGSSCKFVHGGSGFVDSGDNPSTIDALEQYQREVMRSKAAQQQRLVAARYMAGTSFPYNKLNFLQREAQRSAAAGLMMGEEFHRLNRFRMGRNDISEMGYGDSAPGSRQIYLTFPADSTFKEEDVSNYFSVYGPVQDVRIPYQQKRMFGFVTFLYPETVKIILAKGNPHFVCDSRVLVKPYKEKGKLPDKKQQFDRFEFLSCSSPSGLDCREPFEMHVGPRMFYNNQEMLRKKLEQEANWQEALEFQRRRLMNLQLLDLKKHHHLYQQDSSAGSPSHSVSHAKDQNIPPSTNPITEDAAEENQESPIVSSIEELEEEVRADAGNGNGNGNKEDKPEIKASDAPESPLPSATKSAAENQIVFTPKPVEADNGATISTPTVNNDLLIPPATNLNMAPLKSCFFEIPRYTPNSDEYLLFHNSNKTITNSFIGSLSILSGHEAIGM